jgi:dienelactone hydrolase
MRLTRRQTALALAAIGLPFQLKAQPKDPASIPAEAFFQRQQLSQAILSPSGTHVALCVGGDGARRRLVVLDLATMKVNPVAALKEADVDSAYWVNDQRLLFWVHDEQGEDQARGYYAVDADGQGFKRLGAWGALVAGPQNSEFAHITRAQDSSEGYGFFKLIRLNTRTGAETELDVPPWSTGFMLDGAGEPLAALTERGDRAAIHWRDGPGRTWRRVREFERFGTEQFEFRGLGPDGAVYVSARRGHDQLALYTYQPKTDSLSEKPVLAIAQFDLQPELLSTDTQLLGLRVLADATTSVWFDAEAKAIQAQVDAKLPSTSNLLSFPRRGKSPWLTSWSFSDRQPGQAVLFNKETQKLTLLGRAMPQIDPALMSSMDFTQYKARDGRSIPAYLTLPKQAGDKRPLPLIVWVHGGPYVRGTAWGWNAEVQFLASRGYAVLQPEFRGSRGFGDSHFQAGLKQWGLTMQDDLADAAQWAIAQGIADPKRIAIMGGSYGGYAAMMGLVNNPELFRCGINVVGVTDLDLLFSASWSDQSSVFKQHSLPKLIGDRKLDAERLKATSPLHQAARIKNPVMLAYGRQDRRVPIEHGERMRDALKVHNANLEWILYDKEGHGWYRQETHKDFWPRVQRFLEKHLS